MFASVRSPLIGHAVLAPLLSLLCALCFPLSAQTTLAQLREMAARHSYDMQNAALDVQAAEQTSREAFTHYFPTVDAGAAYVKSRKALVEMPMLDFTTMTPTTLTMLEKGKVANLSATQPLFAGGQIVNSNRLARVGERTSRLQQQLTAQDVELKVDQYFWQIVQIDENLRTLDVLDRMLASIRHDAEIAIKAGVRTRNDLLRVQMQEYDLRSKRLKALNGRRTTCLLLGQLAGLKGDSLALATDSVEFRHPQPPERMWVAPAQAALARPEAALMGCKVDAAELQRKIEVGSHLPTVGLAAGLVYNDLLGRDFNTALVAVNVAVPLSGWWGGSHAIKKRKIAETQARNERDNTLELLGVKISQAWNELTEAYDQIGVQGASVASSEENMRVQRTAYNAGTITLSDLMDAQNLLQQARDGLTSALASYQLSAARYRLLTAAH